MVITCGPLSTRDEDLCVAKEILKLNIFINDRKFRVETILQKEVIWVNEIRGEIQFY